MCTYYARRYLLQSAINDLMVPPDNTLGETFYDDSLGVPFSAQGTVTGRFSSNKPNLQNVPRSQNGDIHSRAAKALGISRAEAKRMGFGMTYGMDVGRGKDMTTVVGAMRAKSGLVIIDEVSHVSAGYYNKFMQQMATSMQIPEKYLKGMSDFSLSSVSASLQIRHHEKQMKYQRESFEKTIMDKFGTYARADAEMTRKLHESMPHVDHDDAPKFKRELQGEWYQPEAK